MSGTDTAGSPAVSVCPSRETCRPAREVAGGGLWRPRGPGGRRRVGARAAASRAVLFVLPEE